MQFLNHPDLLFHQKVDETGIDKKLIWLAFMSLQTFTDKQNKDTFMLRRKLICIRPSSTAIVQYIIVAQK